MLAQVEACGGKIDEVFVCPHRPNDNCDCRKPKPGLLLQAAKHFNVEAGEILFIGDSLRDIQAAKACKASAVLVKTGKGAQTLAKNNIDVPVYADLAEAVNLHLLKKTKS